METQLVRHENSISIYVQPKVELINVGRAKGTNGGTYPAVNAFFPEQELEEVVEIANLVEAKGGQLEVFIEEMTDFSRITLLWRVEGITLKDKTPEFFKLLPEGSAELRIVMSCFYALTTHATEDLKQLLEQIGQYYVNLIDINQYGQNKLWPHWLHSMNCFCGYPPPQLCDETSQDAS